MKFKYLIYFILINSFFYTSFSQEKENIAIANISFGPEAKGLITEAKIEAAFNLVTLISGKYNFVDFQTQDSIVRLLKSENKSINFDNLKSHLNLSKVYSLHIDLLANMLRIDMMDMNLNDTSKSFGSGYAQVRYFGYSDNKALFDPSILKALQRAFAVVENDSTMFTKMDSAFYAYPAPTMVISGIEFIDNNSLPKWELFNSKEVNSFLIVESIFDTLRHKNNIILYDQASRDSIYAIFGLKIPENHKATSETELAILSKLEVEYIISGSFNRTSDGAQLILTLMRIKDQKLSFLDKYQATLNEDSKVKLKDFVQQSAWELIKKSEGIYFFKGK